MKALIIRNVADIEGNQIDRGNNNVFTIKPVVAGEDADKCAASFVEIPPGCFAFGYHYHDQNEEIFYVVSGIGTLRTYQGDKSVKAGDMLCFPASEKGAHVLSNSSDTEPLVFIDFSTKSSQTEIVTLPDVNKWMLMGNNIPMTIVDIPKEK